MILIFIVVKVTLSVYEDNFCCRFMVETQWALDNTNFNVFYILKA